MFTITVDDSLRIAGRIGVTLVGRTTLTNAIHIGDFLTDSNDHTICHKIIGIESVRFNDLEKNFTHNPAIIIETDQEPSYFIGKTLTSVSAPPHDDTLS